MELSASRTTLYVIRCSTDGRFVFVSRACAEFLGRRLEEIVGRPIAEILGADAMASIAPQIERVLRGEEVEFEAEISHAYYGRRFMHVISTPDRNERGEVIGWIASIVDVADRKHTKEEIRQMLDVLPVGVWRANVTCTEIPGNRETKSILEPFTFDRTATLGLSAKAGQISF